MTYFPRTYILFIPRSRIFISNMNVLFLARNETVKPEYLLSIRQLTCGAAPLGRSDQELILRKTNNRLSATQGYGLTETSGIATVANVNGKDEIGSSGKPLSCTALKIVKTDDPKGPSLPHNVTGEVLIKGPQIMKGYHKREIDENTFIDDWLRTGDLGYYNENGAVFVTDRLKELIKVKGYQVPPAELEEIIRTFPGIMEAGVIGIPHDKYGEVPRAYVVLNVGAKIDENNLQEYVAQKVSPYKRIIGGVSIIDSIPKTPSGKILRKELSLLYKEKNK